MATTRVAVAPMKVAQVPKPGGQDFRLPRISRTPRAPCRIGRTCWCSGGTHLLVRWSHWLNVPILLGLILSGISIYWSSPIYQHKPDPLTGIFDVAADIGIWICAHVPGLHHYKSPPDWIYNHMSLGPGMLALALRLHWLCAYALMLNGAVYVAGLIAGGGWRGLLPRRTDLRDAFSMFRYYLGIPFAKLTRRQWLHPRFDTKYNAL